MAVKAIGDYKDPMLRFFAYARTRHQIYLDRQAGKPRPWTDDPVLRDYRFTCVFREYDAVTKWFAKHVRDRMKNEPEVMLATVLFRMFNRIPTGEAIFCQQLIGGGTAWERYLEDGKVSLLRQSIKSYVGKKGPYVTGSYIISTPPGSDKLDGVLKIVDEFNKRKCDKKVICGLSSWECAATDMLKWPERTTLEKTCEWLGDFPYLGKFHAYEIVCDLRHTALLRKATDVLSWANLGPGAKRGLNRIWQRENAKDGRDKWGSRIEPEQAIAEMRELLKRSRDAIYWPQGGKRTAEAARRGEDWPQWELREVEHTLCEFDKYERTVSGEGRPRGVFR